MVAALVLSRHSEWRGRLENRSVRLLMRLRCEWEGESWIPGKKGRCCYHSESWTRDVRWQAAATCVPPPRIGASLNAQSIELSGSLLSCCWDL